MHFHWQNLNDDRTRPRRGGGARHGRAWWHFGDAERSRSGATVGFEWSFFWRAGGGAIGLRFHRGDGVGFQLHFGFPWLFSLFLTVDGGWAQRLATRLLPNRTRDRHTGQWRTDYSDRDISLRFFDWAVWWHVWTDPDSWSSRTPKWRDGNFHPVEFIFGPTKVTDKEIAREQVMIPMPERSYAATVVIEDRVWRRPRWPFAWHRHIGAKVDMQRDPVPHPGKGESEYDCGEDATYSSSFHVPAERYNDAVSYAIGEVVASSLDARRRYGGRDWRPTEDHRPKDPPPLAVVKPA